ncbi:hypothetical protein [Asaia lannensis]|uniref:hypothetical protein n=1 Tax=Asaia lannensis TaxID=415421 RepID=UPI003873A599
MAGEIDTSIALQAGRPSINMLNPLEVARQGAEYRNALLGNKIRQSEYDAQKAQGAAYAHHYNPLTGKYDMPALQAELGSTEAGQFGLPDAVTRVRSQQKQQLDNDTTKLALNSKRLGLVAGILAPYANKEGLTKEDLIPAYGSAIAHGLMKIDEANQSYSSLPAGGDGLRQQVRGLQDAAIGPEHAYNDAYGSMKLVDDGGALRWQNVSSPASGQGSRDVGAPITKQTSPDFNNHLVPVTNSDGSPGYDTQGNIAGTTKPTVPLSVMGDGSYSGAANDPFGGSGVKGRATPYVAGPPAGQIEAQKRTAEAGATASNALMQADAARNDRMAMLGNMATDLTNFQSGPGNENWRKIGSIFNNYSPVQIGEDHIEAAQSFNKWAQSVANAQAAALGHSDARLAAAEHAVPNSKLQEGTNRGMIHQLMGNEDAIHAQAMAWQKAGLPPSQYLDWQQKFNQNFDPRAFQVLRMTPAEREKMFKGMRESGQMQKFKDTYNIMAQSGLVPSGR